jgi:hypothetical protein
MKQNIKKRFDDFEDEVPVSRKIIREEKRRPVRNLKQAWQSHEDDFEDFDVFFEK